MNVSRKFFNNKKILIYGMGKSGFSSYLFLKKNNYINLYDDRKEIFKNRLVKKFFLEKNKIFKILFIFIIQEFGRFIQYTISMKHIKLKSDISFTFK